MSLLKLWEGRRLQNCDANSGIRHTLLANEPILSTIASQIRGANEGDLYSRAHAFAKGDMVHEIEMFVIHPCDWIIANQGIRPRLISCLSIVAIQSPQKLLAQKSCLELIF